VANKRITKVYLVKDQDPRPVIEGTIKIFIKGIKQIRKKKSF
jgi:hypothetical protein